MSFSELNGWLIPPRSRGIDQVFKVPPLSINRSARRSAPARSTGAASRVARKLGLDLRAAQGDLFAPLPVPQA
jgi:hypothetical protein